MSVMLVPFACHPEPFSLVILSEAKDPSSSLRVNSAKDLSSFAQGKLREASHQFLSWSEGGQMQGFFAPLRMTVAALLFFVSRRAPRHYPFPYQP